MKTFLTILKTFALSVLAVIIGLIIFSLVSDSKETKKKAAVLETPDLLIAPASTEPPTRAPSSTPIGSDFWLTVTAISYLPTKTPEVRSVKNARVPIYNGNGELIGYVGDSEPTATSVLSWIYQSESERHPAGCNIKGNVSKRNEDEKIYHCPGWRDYDQTEINYGEGDRWFCSEAEAIAAGFRKPQNVSSPCFQ